jgi:hypothetical protein
MNHDMQNEEQIERYLDGLMSDEEAKEFVENIDPQQLAAIESFENQLVGSLQRFSRLTPLDGESIARNYAEAHSVNENVTPNSTLVNPRRNWIQLAVAATLLIATGVGLWFGNSGGNDTVFFKPRSVALIYNETVERGFRPNYNCEEPLRFANTFEKEVGTPMALAELPEGLEMLGLSTLGGASRNTIAMLSKVNGQNVIVFVEQTGHGDFETAIDDAGTGLNIFVEEINGLTFIEVTPLNAAFMIEHFEFLN